MFKYTADERDRAEGDRQGRLTKWPWGQPRANARTCTSIKRMKRPEGAQYKTMRGREYDEHGNRGVNARPLTKGNGVDDTSRSLAIWKIKSVRHIVCVWNSTESRNLQAFRACEE